jgi:hypothetical protein
VICISLSTERIGIGLPSLRSAPNTPPTMPPVNQAVPAPVTTTLPAVTETVPVV